MDHLRRCPDARAQPVAPTRPKLESTTKLIGLEGMQTLHSPIATSGQDCVITEWRNQVRNRMDHPWLTRDGGGARRRFLRGPEGTPGHTELDGGHAWHALRRS